MQVNPGIYGAKVQSWNQHNPRNLLKSMMDGGAYADRDALLARFKAAVLEEPEYMKTIVDYWFANNYHSLVEERKPVEVKARKKAVREAKNAEATAAVVANVVKVIEMRAKIELLGMVLPNGKALRDCTGAECDKMGKHLGPWLQKVAAKVKPAQLVGSALSEKQLKVLYEA